MVKNMVKSCMILQLNTKTNFNLRLIGPFTPSGEYLGLKIVGRTKCIPPSVLTFNSITILIVITALPPNKCYKIYRLKMIINFTVFLTHFFANDILTTNILDINRDTLITTQGILETKSVLQSLDSMGYQSNKMTLLLNGFTSSENFYVSDKHQSVCV